MNIKNVNFYYSCPQKFNSNNNLHNSRISNTPKDDFYLQQLHFKGNDKKGDGGLGIALLLALLGTISVPMLLSAEPAQPLNDTSKNNNVTGSSYIEEVENQDATIFFMPASKRKEEPYKIKSGETLTSIVRNKTGLGNSATQQEINEFIAALMRDNPEITNPNKITAGSIINISVLNPNNWQLLRLS